MRQLQIWCEIFRRFPWWKRVTCGMAALALQFLEQQFTSLQAFRRRIDFCVDEWISHLIEGREVSFDDSSLFFREVECRHASRKPGPQLYHARIFEERM